VFERGSSTSATGWFDATLATLDARPGSRSRRAASRAPTRQLGFYLLAGAPTHHNCDWAMRPDPGTRRAVATPSRAGELAALARSIGRPGAACGPVRETETGGTVDGIWERPPAWFLDRMQAALRFALRARPGSTRWTRSRRARGRGACGSRSAALTSRHARTRLNGALARELRDHRARLTKDQPLAPASTASAR